MMKNSISKIYFLCIFLFLLSKVVYSDENENPETTKNLINNVQLKSSLEDHIPIINVGLDSYYTKSSIRFREQKRPYVTQAIQTDEFSINHALINISKESQSYHYAIGIHAGTYVQANYALEPDQYKPIYQAWAGYALLKNLWLDVGIFPSHIGGESPISFQNFNYTRSLVAENSPYYETGGRIVWNPLNDLKLSFYILNGWQRLKETNVDKAIGTELQYKVSKNWLITYSTFIGNEAPNQEQRQTRYFNDIYLKGKFYDWWEVYLIYDIGFQRKPLVSWVNNLSTLESYKRNISRESYSRWEGFAIQFYFHLNEIWKLGLRAEGFYDPNEIVMKTYTANGYSLESASINIDFIPVETMKFRIEGKYNSSWDKIYNDKSNNSFDRENLVILNFSYYI
jgi:hypothetical protein